MILKFVAGRHQKDLKKIRTQCSQQSYCSESNLPSIRFSRVRAIVYFYLKFKANFVCLRSMLPAKILFLKQ